MSNSSSSGGGISAGFALFLVFLVLKLTNTIDWSWLWVTCPLWIGLAILFVGLTCVGLVKGAIALASGGSKRRTEKRMGLR